MIQILTTLRFTPAMLDQLRAVAPGLRVSQQTCRDANEVAAAMAAHPEIDVLYTFHLPHNALDLAPSLRWLQLHSAGADHILDHPIMHCDVAITTVSGIHATPIAEYVFASILAHRWRVPMWTQCQRDAQWPSNRWNLYARPELRGSTIGIVGYGSIGREVARLAQAFGMRVLALRRSELRAKQGYAQDDMGDTAGTIPERVYTSEDRHAMLAQCDYVIVSLPLTPHTTHFIGEDELRCMKPTAYLVNVARGAVVHESALIHALREGWIAGAGLDVFDQEPLPPNSPLWELDNVLLSPHVAGFTPNYDLRAVALFAENLRRFLAGEPLLNLVDKTFGY